MSSQANRLMVYISSSPSPAQAEACPDHIWTLDIGGSGHHWSPAVIAQWEFGQPCVNLPQY